MELLKMSICIIKILNEKYNNYILEECLDIIQLINICNLYKNKYTNINSITLDEINITTPNFEKIKINNKMKKQIDLLKSDDFKKKYSFFIKIIYSCLQMNVDIFNINNGILTLKNNYQLIKSLEINKKSLFLEHINILKSYCKKCYKNIYNEYNKYSHEFIIKIKILEKIINSISSLIESHVFEKTDNLFSLILPFFYSYTEYIEEYN